MKTLAFPAVFLFLFFALSLSGCAPRHLAIPAQIAVVSKKLDVPTQAITPPEKSFEDCLIIDGVYEAATGDDSHLFLTRGLLTREAEVQLRTSLQSAPGFLKKGNSPGFSKLWVGLKTEESGKKIQVNLLSDIGLGGFVEIAHAKIGEELSCTPAYWESARAYDILWTGREWRKVQEHAKLTLLPSGDLLMDYAVDEWMNKSATLQKREEHKVKATFKRIDALPEDLIKKTEKGKLAIDNYTPVPKGHRRCTISVRLGPWGDTVYIYDHRISKDGKELPSMGSSDISWDEANYCAP
jgi:hypothetical protein